MRKRILKKYYIKAIRRVRYRRGHGVHSPFAFNFITKIVEEKFMYYGYAEVEAQRREKYRGNLTKEEINIQKEISFKVGTLLFRMVNYFKPQNILEIGTAWGTSSLFLHYGDKTSHIHIIESNKKVFDKSVQFLESYPIHIDYDSETNLLNDYLEHYKADFIIVWNRNDSDTLRKKIALLHKHIQDQTVIVIEGIHRNAKNKRVWNEIIQNPKVQVTMDLYDLGIVFCNSKLNKQHYIVSF